MSKCLYAAEDGIRVPLWYRWLGDMYKSQVLRWLPIGTHDWKKFVKPQEMINYVSAQQLIHQETKGVTFNPILNKWSLSNDASVNYMTCFTKS